MKLIFVLVSMFAATCYAANGQGKLQIGIKKRVEDCTTKTRKGDLVHIHYTVSEGESLMNTSCNRLNQILIQLTVM